VGNMSDKPFVNVPTPSGTIRVRVVDVNGQTLLVATSPEIPDVPVVRFHSSCVFGEAFHAVDCDCGAQVTAALQLIGREGGILVYAWEEGRGAGIIDKLRAIAMQQQDNVSTAQAFIALGHQPDPRTFEAHIEALRQVFGGKRVRLASGNPQKITAMESAGFVVERVKLNVVMTPEREAYLDHKKQHLGHINDD
jgi:GTP cyclohydrolase II